MNLYRKILDTIARIASAISMIAVVVMVSFIVNADGSISDIKLVKGAHKLLDDEALRVVRLMPKWKPGLEGGHPCRTMISIPIVFEI